jgi:hypothetical protein
MQAEWGGGTGGGTKAGPCIPAADKGEWGGHVNAPAAVERPGAGIRSR